MEAISIELNEKPYPYFVWDGVLTAAQVQMMRRHWPGEGNFKAEIPGNYICDLRGLVSEGYWREFTLNTLPGFLVPSLAAFADWIEARYPGIDTLHVPHYGLMQTQGGYGGHDVHNHHYHDPTWVMTLLLYLDADATGHHGTTIHQAKNLPQRDAANIAAQTLSWQDLTTEFATIDYRQGRLFAFLDNAIAYHSVKPSLPGSLFGRRIFRLHVTASAAHCERLYGVDYASYNSMRRNPTDNQTVVEWMRRDIEQQQAVRISMTDGERNEWARKLKIII